MAFKTLKTDREVISLAALGDRVAARRRAVDVGEVPRNAGTRRTRSKQALLDAIVKTGGEW